jgi:hypothetical protein
VGRGHGDGNGGGRRRGSGHYPRPGEIRLALWRLPDFAPCVLLAKGQGKP